MKRKVKLFKAFKGAEADTKGPAGGKAMSPGTTTTGGVRQSVGGNGNNNGNNVTTKKTKSIKNLNIPIVGPLTFGFNVLQNLVKPKIAKDYGPYTKTKTKKPPMIGGGDGGSQLCPDGTMPPCKTTPIVKPNQPNKLNFLNNFQAYNSGGISYGPPPKRGPNPQVPPVKMNKGKMNNMSCPHRPDGIRGMGAAIKGHKFIGVK